MKNYMKNLSRMSIACVFTCLIISTATAQTGSELVASLRKGEQHFNEQQGVSGSYRCHVEIVKPDKSGRSSVAKSLCLISRLGGSTLLKVEMIAASNSNKKHINNLVNMCKTKDYHFGISSLKTGSMWSLSRFSTADPNSEFQESLGTFLPAVYPMSVFSGSTMVKQVLENDTFTIHRVALDNAAMISADYSLTLDSEQPIEITGTLTVDPHNHYVIISNVANYSNSSAYKLVTSRMVEKSGATLKCV